MLSVTLRTTLLSATTKLLTPSCYTLQNTKLEDCQYFTISVFLLSVILWIKTFCFSLLYTQKTLGKKHLILYTICYWFLYNDTILYTVKDNISNTKILCQTWAKKQKENYNFLNFSPELSCLLFRIKIDSRKYDNMLKERNSKIQN